MLLPNSRGVRAPHRSEISSQIKPDKHLQLKAAGAMTEHLLVGARELQRQILNKPANQPFTTEGSPEKDDALRMNCAMTKGFVYADQ